MDADAALLAVVDVIPLRDVDKSSAPPPSPSWSRDVCLVCLVLVFFSVTATEVAVLTMLPPFETACDVRVLLDDTVATTVVSVVDDARSIAALVVVVVVVVFVVVVVVAAAAAAVLEIFVNTVLITPRVRSAVMS